MITHTKITITVGAGIRSDGTKISQEEACSMRERSEQVMLEQCGAYTVSLAKGGWRDGSEGPDWRESVFVFTVTVKDYILLMEDSQKLAARIRDIFQQQCVALETQQVNFELV